jgi:hypothetical protein
VPSQTIIVAGKKHEESDHQHLANQPGRKCHCVDNRSSEREGSLRRE